MPRTIFVFDIDSTIADNSHRASLLEKRCTVCLHSPMPVEDGASCPSCASGVSAITQESWDSFLDVDVVMNDAPIKGAIQVLSRLRELGAEICFLTGRHRSRLGTVTETWLAQHAGWDPDSEILFMREPEDEKTPASVYKERALKRLKDHVSDESALYIFFEDDPHVFSLYNRHGIVVRCPEAWSHFMPAGARGEEPVLAR